jgi:hypothetical protein
MGFSGFTRATEPQIARRHGNVALNLFKASAAPDGGSKEKRIKRRNKNMKKSKGTKFRARLMVGMKKSFALGATMTLLLLLLIEGVSAADSWAPSQYGNPNRYYDSGTYVGYVQNFQWDQSHVNELHSQTGSNGKYQHEFRRVGDKWDAMDSSCNDYGWWTNLPDDELHSSNEENSYWWCDVGTDEEAELVTYGPLSIQAGQNYYMQVLFKKIDTSGTLTLKTKSECNDFWLEPGADADCQSYLTETTENP